jgi:hypothetical protein
VTLVKLQEIGPTLKNGGTPKTFGYSLADQRNDRESRSIDPAESAMGNDDQINMI